MTPSALTLVGLLTVLSASAAFAQRPDSLPVGAELRVTIRNSRVGELRGTLEGADSSAMFLTSLGRAPFLIRYTEIESVLIARGREPRPGGASRGARQGLMVGGAIGIVATAIAFAYDLRSSGDAFIPASVVMGIYGLGLTAVTTAIGAVIGATSRTRWEHAWPQ